MTRYLYHITLTTGHTRRSWRHEIAPDLWPALASLVETAREASGVILPGVQPRCRLMIEDTSRCALCSVRLEEDDLAVVTFGIAAHARCGKKIWEILHDTARTPVMTQRDRRPQAPWCAVRIEPAAALFPPPHPLLPTLADMERCIAWAWLDRKK